MCLVFAIEFLWDIYKMKDHDLVSKIAVFDETNRPQGPITLDRFNNSLHFMTGFAAYDDQWDVLNNPYIEFHGFEFRTGINSSIAIFDKYELRLCTSEESFFLGHNVKGWYPQGICFNDRSAVEIE